MGDKDQILERPTTQATTQVDDKMLHLLKACAEPSTLADLMKSMGYRSRKHLRTAILGRTRKNGLIEQAESDKPRSPLQRYRITEKGKEVLKSIPEKNQG